MEEVTLLGYWNRSKERPEITFNPPVEDDGRELFIITIREIPRTDSPVPSEFKKFNSVTKKLTGDLKNLATTIRRLK